MKCAERSHVLPCGLSYVCQWRVVNIVLSGRSGWNNLCCRLSGTKAKDYLRSHVTKHVNAEWRLSLVSGDPGLPHPSSAPPPTSLCNRHWAWDGFFFCVTCKFIYNQHKNPGRATLSNMRRSVTFQHQMRYTAEGSPSAKEALTDMQWPTVIFLKLGSS